MPEKKYYLSRFKPTERYVISRFTASEAHGGENIGPIYDYGVAQQMQREANARVYKPRKKRR